MFTEDSLTYISSDSCTTTPYKYTQENENDWNIEFYCSGTLTLEADSQVDIFMIGGGGGGGTGGDGYEADSASGGGGGGGGYRITENNYVLEKDISYEITIGSGGAANASGGSTSIKADGSDLFTAVGGLAGGTGAKNSSTAGTGGDGGSAGGTGGYRVYGGSSAGGSAGVDGVYAFGDPIYGQYGGGGGGGGGGVNPVYWPNGVKTYRGWYMTSGADGGAGGGGYGGSTHGDGSSSAGATNTGGGGGGGSGRYITASAGGSGIVIIRNVRDLYAGSTKLGKVSALTKSTDEGNGNWNVEFLTSGAFIPATDMTVDIFMVGGGGGGGKGGPSGTGAYGGGGGGSGYFATHTNVSLIAGQTYELFIGNGGASSSDGEPTSISSSSNSFYPSISYSVRGGLSGDDGVASGIGIEPAGGIGGKNGGAAGLMAGHDSVSKGGIAGVDGIYAFNGTSGKMYAGGGGGGNGAAYFEGEGWVVRNTGGAGGAGGGGAGADGWYGAGDDGAANTGGGGGGSAPPNVAGGHGGSGIIIIRNSR